MLEHWQLIIWVVSLVGLIIIITPSLFKWLLKETLREIRDEMNKAINKVADDNDKSIKHLSNISSIHNTINKSILNKIHGDKDKEREIAVYLESAFGDSSISDFELKQYYLLSDEIITQMKIAYHKRMIKENDENIRKTPQPINL